MILIPKIFSRVNDEFVFDDLIDATPITESIKHPLIGGQPNDDTRFQAKFYSKFALDIVTETVFNYPYPFITEKTLRPIACKRMFIVLGPVGILSTLKSKGFETFSDIIDESYDSMINPTERFNAVVKSINLFISLPLEEIKLYYYQNQGRFENNFQTLKNLRGTELADICSKLKISFDIAKLKNSNILNYDSYQRSNS